MIYEMYIEFIKENYHLYIILILLLVGLPIQKVAIPHYYGNILSSLKGKDVNKSTKLFGYLLIAYCLVGVFNILTSYINKIIWPKMQSFVRKKLFTKIITSYNESYEDLKTGEILTKMQEFPWVIDTLYNKIQKFIFNNSIIIISSLIYLSRYHYKLGLAYIISIGCIIGLSYFYVINCKETIVKEINTYTNFFEEISDTLSNLISIFCNKKMETEIQRLNEKSEEVKQNEIVRNTCDVKYKFIYSIINIMIFIMLNYTAYDLYIKKKITIDALTSIFIINFSLLDDLLVLYYDTKEMVFMKGHIDVFNKFIDSLPKQQKDQSKVKEFGLQKSIDIKFKNVDFKHKGNDKYTYKDLNLHIPPNQDILIMGHIGSGKSTFAKLLTNLQNINGGDIFINGNNIKELNTDNIRNNILYVPQHPQLFNRTLYENLTYGLEGDEKVDVEVIYKMLDNLDMEDFKNVLKDKMNKSVGKNGSNLSGGQRQMIWLLRTIFKKSPMIIMDEPTASLDEESKKDVFELIKLIKKNKSVLVISHDKSFESLFDRLITFKDGKIDSDQILR